MGILPIVLNADGIWVPGIGDRSLMGWLTVAAYFATACFCYRASTRVRRHNRPADSKLVWAYLGLAAMLIGLGCNKQLDLQSLLTQIGKDMAHAQGWYDQRRTVQAACVAAIGFTSVVASGVGLWWLRDKLNQVWPAVVGMATLLGFVVIRAASFHHVDWILYRATGPIQLNWILELGSVACIAWSTMRPALLGPADVARSNT